MYHSSDGRWRLTRSARQGWLTPRSPEAREQVRQASPTVQLLLGTVVPAWNLDSYGEWTDLVDDFLQAEAAEAEFKAGDAP